MSRSADSMLSHLNWKPLSVRRAGCIRDDASANSASSPMAIRSAKRGTVKNAGRDKTLASARVNSALVAGLGADTLTGPCSDGVLSA